MIDKEEINELRIEILEIIPKKFEDLRKIILTRRFSEDELIQLIRIEEKIEFIEMTKISLEKNFKELENHFSNLPPGKEKIK